ncbi:WD domain, G-beta repeat protein (macronuclear) [Tetrahymena thermophila SB210]|uniref:WD domain, G-beta repeat protein n=1 Tax=Tetrahymena thermophila (strain SB210) TaxID=312017 RepID=Q22EH8_TETTS|nr:WD domain, G-beta repeat protein [Tetrahymena thermophila SB210]EAR83674.2 WD domain, G-beta repeat protein [Tetrahymena thermophila SB210]|eukprot:XP_001031337.2 WD domain, G-beta repeat protein [Tetrahymena thermophila SB210]
MDIEQEVHTSFEQEIKNYFDKKGNEYLKKQEQLEKELWNDINKETRNDEEELKKVQNLIKIERFLKYYDLLIACSDQILESLVSKDKKITEPVEEDFIYGGMILEEMEDSNNTTFKNIIQKYGMNTNIDPIVKKAIKDKFDADEKIEPKDVADFLKRYQKKFGVKTNGDEEQNNDEEDRESNWENSSSVAGDDIIEVDDDLLNEMDKSYDEEGNEITYEEKHEGEEEEEEEKKEDNQESDDTQNISREKTVDMSIKTFLKHTDFVSCLSFHPINPDVFISGGGDDVARVWNITNNDKPEIETPKQNETVDFAKFSFDGKYFATGCLDGVVKIWDGTTGEFKRALEGPSDEIRFLEWHSKGNVILAGSADNSAWMWNAANGQYMASFNGHEQPVTCGGFTPDGNMVITGSEDATVRIWKPKSGELHKKLQGYGFHEEMITCMAFHQTQQIIITGSTDKTACISNYSNGKILGRTPAHDDGVEAVLFDQKLDIFLTGSLDGFVRIFDLNRLTLKDKITVNASITKMIQIKDKNLFAVANCLGDIYYFDHRVKGKINRITSGTDGMIHDLALHKSNRLLASFDDGSIKLFEVQLEQ